MDGGPGALASNVLGAVVLVAAAACSQTPTHPPELGNIPGDDSGLLPPFIDAGWGGDAGPPLNCPSEPTCDTLKNCAKHVDVAFIAMDAPAPVGGTVVPGVYQLTDVKLFLGVGGMNTGRYPWFRETMQIVDGAIDAGANDAQALDGGGQPFGWLDITQTNSDPTHSQRGTISIAPPSSITYDITCTGDPAGGPSVFYVNYTTTPGQLLTYVAQAVGTAEFTYALR
jgi:hypothetical protein